MNNNLFLYFMINIHCISLQSKRNNRFCKIKKCYNQNYNLIEIKAIEGADIKKINHLKKEMKIKFDNKASYGNQALLLNLF